MNISLFINPSTRNNNDVNEVNEVNTSLLINTNVQNNNTIEFPVDVWCEIKEFKTNPYFNLDADSFIIKDVVLDYVVTIGDGYIEQRNVFKFVNDIIHSKRFLNFQIRNKIIKKQNEDFFNLH